ncbi:MAG: DNA primase catalytic subunit PriS [Candidatus Micrarchaeota archaeon]|nr:DNA primase catalytic subunit PriS [Candidatus Micrarchaeota archaeon]
MDEQPTDAPHHSVRTLEEEFLHKKFSSHYSQSRINVLRPESREFGFGGWEKKIEFRHIRVKNESELRSRLVSEAPLYISHSVAYYEFPDARPMVKKNWLSADLVFDLDAEGHTCGKFTCQHCMEKVKGEAHQLIEEFLLPDFGFSKNELSINFSGSRGYHVHVRSEAVAQLDREARREIADYVTGTGLLFDRLFWKEGKKFFGPKTADGGFGGKFARAFVKRLDNDEFALSISRKLKKPEEREKLRASIQTGNWDNIGIANREEKLAEKFAQMRLTLAGRIDANVTADTSKLIRMADSIHGGSGFAAKSVDSLDAFEPMKDAPIFNEGEQKVKITEAVPALTIRDHSFGPFVPGATATLPMACAVYLLCKKAATLA